MTGTTPIDTIIQGDCLEEMKKLPDRSIDAIVTDPPYELTSGNSKKGFMGKAWDGTGIAYNVEMWGECLRVLKPGGHLLAFGGTRTYHRMACAIEDAGFEIRDSIHWVYGCLSPDTEIMINGKWERYHKANIGDLTICYNNETDSYSWQPIQEVFEYRIKDTAYRIQSDLTDQIVTRGHRCLIERKGRLLFCFAEEAAQEQKIRVPVLEDLRGLLKALPMPYKSASPQEHNMFVGMCKNTNGSGKGRTTQEGQYRTDLPGLRQAVSNLESMGKESGNSNVLQALQRHSSGRGLEETRTQRSGGLDARERSELFREDERVEKSGMERRCNLLQNARQLSGREICPMPSEISINGSERWLCNGAPLNSCSEDKAMPEEIRGCASYQPRPDRQPLRESSAIQNQPGPQEIRGAGITRTTLARIEPIEYDGIVWCVRVPTGAFVARRGGKIFVTGNSGFPKSLDISKKLDQMAGSEREIISTERIAPDGHVRRNVACVNKQYGTMSGAITAKSPITAPSTDAAKQWAGWGSALKPAHEPVVLARKPLDGCTIAENVLRWGCGGLNIDACRIASPDKTWGSGNRDSWRESEGRTDRQENRYGEPDSNPGKRFPSNLIHDASPVVLAEFAKAGERKTGHRSPTTGRENNGTFNACKETLNEFQGSFGSASRFFMACEFTPADYAPIVYYAKASRSERERGLDGMPDKERGQRYGLDAGGYLPQQTPHKHEPAKNFHPTVKPLALMRYLCRLITPPGGIILDPFGGSGTTGLAAMKEGFHYILIEKEPGYCEIARKRVAAVPARLDGWAEAVI